MKRIFLPLFALTIFAFSAISLNAETATAPADTSTPILRVGDKTITDDSLRQKYPAQFYDAEKAFFQARTSLANDLAKETLFDQAAHTAGLSRADWNKQQIDAKIPPATDQEINDLIQRMQGGRPVDPSQTAAMKQQAVSYIAQQHRTQIETQLFNDLSQKAAVQTVLARPIAPRIDIPFDAKLNPVRGPKDAPVTITEFTDFQCPWCQRSQPAIKQVETTYAGKVKMIAHNFPLTQIHPRAEPAAEASVCAREQGKYWEYRDKLFDKQQLSDADFTRYAQELGMNEKKFAKCIANHKGATDVQTDIALGQKSGVQGTPTFFVNGIKVSYNELDDTVKSELAKTNSK